MENTGKYSQVYTHRYATIDFQRDCNTSGNVEVLRQEAWEKLLQGLHDKQVKVKGKVSCSRFCGGVKAKVIVMVREIVKVTVVVFVFSELKVKLNMRGKISRVSVFRLF